MNRKDWLAKKIGLLTHYLLFNENKRAKFILVSYKNEFFDLWEHERLERTMQAEEKSREMKRRRDRGKYGEKKIAKIVGGKVKGGPGMEDVKHSLFSFEVKWLKKAPQSIVGVMNEAHRHAPQGKIAVGVIRGKEDGETYFIFTKNSWLELHGEEK